MGESNDLSELLVRRHALQARLLEAGGNALIRTGRKATAKNLVRELHHYLNQAYDHRPRLIQEPPQQVRRQVILVEGPNKKIPQATASIMVGTVRNFRRTQSLPHFTRDDDWWFDFQLTVRESKNRLEILAYSFEVRPPADTEAPFSFVRFDLNPPDHENEGKGLRAHMHLGTDDDGFSLPTPIFSPIEVLDIIICGLRPTGRNRS